MSAVGGFDATSTLVYTSGDATAEVKVLSSGKSYVDLSYKVRRFRVQVSKFRVCVCGIPQVVQVILTGPSWKAA